jgi:hypothetical protein
MEKTLTALIALTALTTIEHNGVKYGPGQMAGTDFQATELEAEPLLQVKAVKKYDPNDTTVESQIVEQAVAAAQSASAALSQANSALEKARLDTEAATEAQAKADADAQAVADARAKLDADIKAFEEAKAAAAKANVKKN